MFYILLLQAIIKQLLPHAAVFCFFLASLPDALDMKKCAGGRALPVANFEGIAAILEFFHTFLEFFINL